jgi:GT2 family glycosyltransferase
VTSAAALGPRILVLLPVHNRQATTALFIRCLLAQSYANWHLLLIDDGSTDGTADMVRRDVPRLSVLRGDGNWWWGGALHQGYLWLTRHDEHSDDLVLIINDDTEFASDFLERAVRVMQPRSLLLAQLYSQAGELVETGVRWDWRTFNWKGVKETDGLNCFSTRGLFLWARDFREIGGFHPVLLPHYMSDYEFTMRARGKGFPLISRPEVFLRYNEQLTGVRNHEGLSLVQYLKTSLSIKSTNNPVYWSSFVVLACPSRYVPANLTAVWWRFWAPFITRLRPYQITYRIVRRIYRMARRVPHS